MRSTAFLLFLCLPILSLSGCLDGPHPPRSNVSLDFAQSDEGPTVDDVTPNPAVTRWRIDERIEGWAWFWSPLSTAPNDDSAEFYARFTPLVPLEGGDMVILGEPMVWLFEPGEGFNPTIRVTHAFGPDDREMVRWGGVPIHARAGGSMYAAAFLMTTVPGHLELVLDAGIGGEWQSWSPRWAGKEPLQVRTITVPDGEWRTGSVDVKGSVAALLVLEDDLAHPKERTLSLGSSQPYRFNSTGERDERRSSMPPGLGWFALPPSVLPYAVHYAGTRSTESYAVVHHPVDIGSLIEDVVGQPVYGDLLAQDAGFLEFWYGSTRP